MTQFTCAHTFRGGTSEHVCVGSAATCPQHRLHLSAAKWPPLISLPRSSTFPRAPVGSDYHRGAGGDLLEAGITEPARSGTGPFHIPHLSRHQLKPGE